MTISQEAYVDKILKRVDITNTASTLASVSTSRRVEKEEETKEDFPYRETVGCVMWLAINIRPGIADAVRAVACHDPTAEDWRNVLRILAYLNENGEVGITYERSTCSGPVANAGSDYVNSSDRKSVSGRALIFNGMIVSAISRTQRNKMLSSTEAEYVSWVTW